MIKDDLMYCARWHYDYDLEKMKASLQLTDEEIAYIIENSPYITHTEILTKEQILEKYGYEL